MIKMIRNKIKNKTYNYIFSDKKSHYFITNYFLKLKKFLPKNERKILFKEMVLQC